MMAKKEDQKTTLAKVNHNPESTSSGARRVASDGYIYPIR